MKISDYNLVFFETNYFIGLTQDFSNQHKNMIEYFDTNHDGKKCGIRIYDCDERK